MHRNLLSRRGFCVLLSGAALNAVHPSGLTGQSRFATEESEHDGPSWAFASPPDSSRPYVLWMWMGSNVTREGITRDLEAMKDAGIGGATIFSLADTVVPWAGVIGKSPTPEIVAFQEPWWRMVRHAATEAHRLGLELILHNCAGYESSGGPWITPELSMQEVVWSKTKVAGGRRFNSVLPRATVDPHPHAMFPRVFIPELGRIDNPIVKARQEYYHDLAVIAVPSEGTVSPEQLVLLSARMDEHGALEWDAPAGDWTVYRFGHTTTGAMIQPAAWGAMGLECDKMNKEAVTFHVQHVLAEMKAHLGDMMGKGVTTLYFDSYEAGEPTWTPKMREEFQARRGYDIIPWLPALAGRTLRSVAETARFKADFKRTTFDLFRDCYWATPGPLAHEAGLQFAAEPYDGPWVIGEVVESLDRPVVEFWTNNGVYSPVSAVPVIKAAHALGKQLIAAESFTSDPKVSHWDETPGWLKPIGDAAFCAGINRLNFHHCVQQPWDARYKPGNTMGQWGVHFGRNQTWWEPGKAWLKYLWRCQNLLQRGVFVEASPAKSAAFSLITGKAELKSIRRDIGDAVVFFVANVARSAGTVRVTLPVSAKQPELWDPVWGTIRDISAFEQHDGVTSFELAFAEAQSFFLVFRRPVSKRTQAKSNSAIYEPLALMDGSWKVSFDPVWGGPASVVFPELQDWTHHDDPGIRYYSGTATYRKTLHLEKLPGKDRMLLDLGVCRHLASVTVNGKKAGVLWTAPWRLDITGLLRRGDNSIEIAVTNVWANRLIGDEQQPPDWTWEVGDAKVGGGEYMKEFPDWFLKGEPRPSKGRYTFVTWNYFKKDSPLVPSGLLGPVTLVREA